MQSSCSLNRSLQENALWVGEIRQHMSAENVVKDCSGNTLIRALNSWLFVDHNSAVGRLHLPAGVVTTSVGVMEVVIEGVWVGTVVGVWVGGRVSSVVGNTVGIREGGFQGKSVGVKVGYMEGVRLGNFEGSSTGLRVGALTGSRVGVKVVNEGSIKFMEGLVDGNAEVKGLKKPWPESG